MADAPAKGCNVCIRPAVEEVRQASRKTPTDESKHTDNIYEGWCVRFSFACSRVCRYSDLGIYSIILDDGNVGCLRERSGL